MAPSKPSIVFAHGLWADGSCYSKLIPVLQREGYEVVSAQNSLDSLEGDVEAVHRALGRVSSPAVLVGHSWGGFVITAAGTDERVAGLVYIGALGPESGETPQELIGRFDAPPLFSHLDTEDGRIWISRDGISDFCGDLPEEEQRAVLRILIDSIDDEADPGCEEAWEEELLRRAELHQQVPRSHRERRQSYAEEERDRRPQRCPVAGEPALPAAPGLEISHDDCLEGKAGHASPNQRLAEQPFAERCNSRHVESPSTGDIRRTPSRRAATAQSFSFP